ncbi:MAG: 30S ribosome-binding factor RbfA [Phycisphaerae bacterium]|nr:30S ribosome-binding factor RbfA [Phycisphaerae bacterium]
MSSIGLKRLASQIRLVVSDALQNKLSDPRLERLASVTRVELSPDLSYADVYISVMGTEGQQKAYMKAVDRAHGHLQSLVARKLRTRTCPTARFHLDQSLKKGFETIQLIDKTMAELADRQEQEEFPDQPPPEDPEANPQESR